MKQQLTELNINTETAQTEVLNPEQEPRTPKKLGRFAEFPSSTPSLSNKSSPSPSNRLKFRYTITQKPKSSPLSTILFCCWLLFTIVLVFSSYSNKLTAIKNSAQEEQQQCKTDFQKNKCEKGLKATISYCEQKSKCFQTDPQIFYQSKVNGMFIAGEILKGFLQGAGLYVSLGALAMVWIVIRKQPNKQIKKEYQQYFE